MDFISNRTIETTTLALDALSARHKLLSANVANADSPGYKRSDLKFEDQLSKIIETDRQQEYMRQNPVGGLTYSATSFDVLGQMPNFMGASKASLDQQYQSFKPEQIDSTGLDEKPNGNNVNIESEMVELSKNGMKYTAITGFQEKAFRGILDIIKGVG